MLEAYLPTHQKDASAHAALAHAHWTLANRASEGSGASGGSQQSHLEKAVEHTWSAVALMKNLDAAERVPLLDDLLGLYGPDALDRPSDVERVARRLIEENPSRAAGYKELARVMRETGRSQEVTVLLRDAHFVIAPDAQRDLAEAIGEHIRRSASMPAADVENLVGIMMAIGDDGLRTNPGDQQSQFIKQAAVELRATRLGRASKTKATPVADATRRR
jgi:hypothetical protein